MINTRKIKVLVFPRDKNPYQKLLYAPMKDLVEIKYLYDSPPTKINKILIIPIMAIKLTLNRLRGYKTLHIHWLYPFALPSWIPFSLFISFVYTIIFLYLIKMLNYHVVWTAHNVLPHETLTINDLYIRKMLANISKCTIVHSTGTISSLNQKNIKPNSIKLIPHGNYINVYFENVKKLQSRKSLGIDKNQFVILLFGAVRRDKGIEKLIKEFVNLSRPDASLLIAGKCRDQRLARVILKASKEVNIRFINQYIPDDEVTKYFKSSDIFCVPFTENTTSGSVILAMSLGLSVIAPRIGSINDMPNNTGVFYSPDDSEGLKKSLEFSIDNKSLIQSKSISAYRYMETLDWNKIAIQTTEVFKQINGLRR